MHVQVNNTYSQVLKFDYRGEEEVLDESLTVMTPGYKYMPSYKAKHWDGTHHFYHKNSQRFPTGFLSLIVKEFQTQDFPLTVDDIRVHPTASLKIPETVRHKLRDYQEQEIDRVLHHRLEIGGVSIPWRRGVLKHPTGSGKSISALGLIETVGMPTLYLIERKRLLHQFAEQYTTFTGKDPGMIGDSIFRLGRVTIASVASLVLRLEDKPVRDFLDVVQVVLVDECFVGETNISTPKGDIPIRDMRPGDEVYAYDHDAGKVVVSRVTRLFVRPLSGALQKVQYGEQSYISTTDHRVWNARTDQYEAVTGPGRYVLTLPERFSCNQVADLVCQKDWNAQVPNVWEGKQAESLIQDYEGDQLCLRRGIFSAYARQQPNAERSYSPESESHPQADASQAQGSGWQWASSAVPTSTPGEYSQLANRSGSENEYGLTISELLQTRHCSSYSMHWYRSGRQFSLCTDATTAGPEEDRLLQEARVHTVTVFQRGNSQRPLSVCPSGLVYDLEVEGQHNYFANGVLVHNCQHVKSGRYTRILSQCRYASVRLGLSGTPLKRGDLGDVQLIGSTGDLISTLDRSPLENEGYLAKVRVKFLQVDSGRRLRLPYNEAYRQLIVENDTRNQLVVRAATNEVIKHGAKVLILVRYLLHGRILRDLFAETSLKVMYIHGSVPSDEQKKVIDSFETKGGFDVIIATAILDEGVDIPAANVLIMAGGGQSEIKTVQRVGRVVRPKVESDYVRVYDFMDKDNDYLLKHSLTRLQTYKSEHFRLVKMG